MPANLLQTVDGDNAFVGVNSKLAPHLIPSGYVSNAVNRIFDNNAITNRWGIIEPVWGGVWGENVAGNFNSASTNVKTLTRASATLYPHAANRIITGDVSWRFGTTSTANLIIQSGTRVVSDNGTTLVIDKSTLMPISSTTTSLATYNSTVGFSDIVGVLPYNYSPNDTDGLLIAVNEARSDGGNGRIFFVSPSQPPYEITTNGYDFYDNVKFIQCAESIVLLRPGNLRSYFNGEAGAVKVTFVSHNTTFFITIFSSTNHGLKTGDFIYSNVAISGTNNPVAANTLYYVTVSDSNAFYLSTTANPTSAFFYNLSLNLSSNPVTFQRGYIKLNAEADFETGDLVSVGQVGNSKALWEYKNITAVISSNSVFTKIAHGFAAGDRVVIITYTGSGITVGYNYFVLLTNVDTFSLSLSQGGSAITGLTNGNCTLSLASSISTFYANVQGNRISLHSTAANARSQTSALIFKASSTVSSNNYFFELQKNSSVSSINERVDDWENDAPPIMMQPFDQTVTGSSLIQGFKRIPASNYISQYDAALDTITVTNHGFVAGDKVVISNVSGIEFWHGFDNDDALDDLQITSDYTFYVYPIDSNTLSLYKNRTGTSAQEDSLTKSSRALGTLESNYSVKVLKAGSGYTSPPAIRAGNLTTDTTLTVLTSVISDGKVASVSGSLTSASLLVFEMPNSLIDIKGTQQVIATIKKFGANAQPVPTGRDGIYFQGRLLVLFGPDNLAVSDILDPLHYSPVLSVFKLSNVGSDNVVAIYPFNTTTIIIFKEKSIFSISNIQGDLSQVVLTEITREYGCVAPLSIAGTGSDVLFLSQRGIVSLKQTEFGISQSVTMPLSTKIEEIIKDIDPQKASNSSGIYFENRYFLSIPILSSNASLKGLNTRTVVFNFVLKEWEGYWEGDMLIPKYWVKLLINKKNCLAWVDSAGFIRYFDSESLVDRASNGTTKEIATLVEFRGYSGKTLAYKQWTDVSIELLTNNPTYSIEALFDGVNEIQKITLVPETRNKIKYLTYGTSDYDVSNSKDDFLNPYREDYSVSLTTGANRLKLGLNGLKLKIKQSFLHKARLKKHSASIQLKLITTTGSVDVLACEVRGVPFRLFGKIDS